MRKEIGNEWKNISVSAQQLNLLTVCVQSVIVSILLRKIVKRKLVLKGDTLFRLSEVRNITSRE